MAKFANLSIKLLETNKQIEKKILEAIEQEANDLFSSALNKIELNLQLLILDLLENSPEIKSLQGGLLAFDFGIRVGDNVVDNIMLAIIGSMRIDFKPFKFRNNGSVKGGLTIKVQPTTFSNILRLPEAVTVTELKVKLPWLEWLLTEGDSIIILDYGVKYQPKGRSGGATMSKKSKPFKVNSAFSGTPDDNFITRAFDGKDSEFGTAIEKAL